MELSVDQMLQEQQTQTTPKETEQTHFTAIHPQPGPLKSARFIALSLNVNYTLLIRRGQNARSPIVTIVTLRVKTIFRN